MIAEKIWKLQNQKFPKTKLKGLKEQGFSLEMSKILLLKNLDTKEKIDSFLKCSLDHLHDPFLLPDIDKFLTRIKQAKENNEKILVYGDYDVDGTVAASILTRALKHIEITNIITLAPHRKYGYGLKEKIIKGAKYQNVSLIITCDCGSGNVKEIEYANNLGIDVIVTDHHETINNINPYAFINPKRDNSNYPFKELCGAGIVFKIIQALEKEYPDKIKAMRCLDYIAIATVADVSPLIDENRIIVKFGMEKLSKTKNIPLLTMLKQLSLHGREFTSEMIGFIIGPRLNAPGRISAANITLKFLLSDDPVCCLRLFKKINELNEKRKKVEAQIKENAVKMLDNTIMDKVIILGSKQWHKGVIGIVASVISKFYTRPTILFSIDEHGNGYGSARNIEEFDLLNALEKCKDLIKGYGGHAMAAGITIKEENIEAFRKRMNEIAEQTLTDESLIPYIKADLELNDKNINIGFVRELEQLEPFGNCNEIPRFILKDVTISDFKQKDRHLNLRIVKGSKTFNAPGFWMDEYAQLIKEDNQEFDVLFELNENVYEGNHYIQLVLEDMKEHKLDW